MEDSTSIDDLPNPTFGSGGGGGSGSAMGAVTNNIENVKSQTQVVDPKYMNYIINGIQQTNGSSLGSLPSRDIPMNTLDIQQDNHIRANYIPPPPAANGRKVTFESDYVDDYERRHNTVKKVQKPREVTTTILFEDFYFPILAAILFFIFQMPVFSHMMFKYLKFLYNTDGNLTNIGILFKSIIFGLILSAGVYIADPKNI